MVAKILLSSDLEVLRNTINKYLSEKGLKLNHPDVFYLESGEKLGVEQAKKIKEFLSIKPFQAKGRGVVLENASLLTHEAQNALLKTLEELPEQTIFIMGATNDSSFLPTALSRCEIITLKSKETFNPTKTDSDIEKLLDATFEERFEYIEKLKDKELFLKELVSFFHYNLSKYQNQSFFLSELLEAEKWSVSNVNIRAILEYLMLIMPEASR